MHMHVNTKNSNLALTLDQRQHELLEEGLGDGVVAAHVAQQSQQNLQTRLTV